MRALDARHVHEAGGTANQHRAGKAKSRNRLQTALGQSAGPIADAATALERACDHGMRLEALELLIGRKVGIGVVEVDNETDRHQVGAIMIKEGAAPRAVVQRPTERVLHEARTVPRGRHLPQFFEAEPKLLRLAALAQAESG